MSEGRSRNAPTTTRLPEIATEWPNSEMPTGLGLLSVVRSTPLAASNTYAVPAYCTEPTLSHGAATTTRFPEIATDDRPNQSPPPGSGLLKVVMIPPVVVSIM